MRSLFKSKWGLGILIMCLNSCSQASPPPNDPIPNHETITIQSKIVNEERTITIWKPEDYEKSSDSLMVLYMLDGGIKEDFPHVANTIEKLIEAKKIPNLILVGIENTQRRKDLTGPTVIKKDMEVAPVVGGSATFRAFIAEELIPHIENNYRVSTKRGIIGESVAGLFVTETFLIEPQLFDIYIAFDPSLWWNDRFLLKNAETFIERLPSQKKIFWFAGSGAKDISKNVKNLHTLLSSKPSEYLKIQYEDEKNEKHHTIFRATKEKALIWSLNQ